MEIARWDELQLVQRCKEGSESAFAELVRRHRPRLFSLAYRLTGDAHAAEDIVQETFVAAFRAIDRFQPRPSLSAWLNTIAIHLASRSSQRTGRTVASLDAMVEQDGGTELPWSGGRTTDDGDPHAAAEAAELRRELAAAINALPFKYRAAVVTRHLLGLDYAEAAASLEMGLNTYKSHLLRGTRMLRDAMAGRLAGGLPEPVTNRAAQEFHAVGATDAGEARSARAGPPRATVAASPDPRRPSVRPAALADSTRLQRGTGSPR